MPWTIGQFPELNHLDPDQRIEVLRRVPWWTYPLMFARSLVFGCLFGGFYTIAAGRLFGITLSFAVVFFITMALAHATLAYYSKLRQIRTVMRQEIAMHFRGQRPPFCFGCGYDVRECVGGLCPECGRSIFDVSSS